MSKIGSQWENVKLVESTLSEFITAKMNLQGWGRERIFVREFFGDREHTVVEEYHNPYVHNIAQWAMKSFFEGLGYRKIFDGNPDSEAKQAAVFEDIECDFGKTFRGYSTAAVGYEKAGTAQDTSTAPEKVLVLIEKEHHERQVHYRVFSTNPQSNLLKDWVDYARKNNLYKGKKITAACQFLDLKDITWEEVILPDGIRRLLQTMVIGAIKKESLYLKNKLSLKRGIMLSGKPGNGKTSIIKVIAKDSPISVIYAQPCHLNRAQEVKYVCDIARDLAPCILVIEDIDWIAEDRESGDAGRVIELMNQLDGIEEFKNVITIATTNNVEKIEAAVKNRPGRFDRVITVDNPDAGCRAKMLAVFTKHWEVDASVDVAKVVKFTEDLSGAHMADLCQTAARYAMEGESLDAEGRLVLKGDHFDLAVKEVKDKDYSTYQKAKSGGKKKPMGFNSYDDEDM